MWLDLLRLYKGLDSLNKCAYGLDVTDPPLLQAFLIVLLFKARFSGIWGLLPS